MLWEVERTASLRLHIILWKVHRSACRGRLKELPEITLWEVHRTACCGKLKELPLRLHIRFWEVPRTAYYGTLIKLPLRFYRMLCMVHGTVCCGR